MGLSIVSHTTVPLKSLPLTHLKNSPLCTLQTNKILYPDELGRLFLKDEESDETFSESSLRKFGIEKVFPLIEECLPLDAEWADTHSNALPLFMVAASYGNCAASVMYHLLRTNVHALLGNVDSN